MSQPATQIAAAAVKIMIEHRVKFDRLYSAFHDGDIDRRVGRPRAVAGLTQAQAYWYNKAWDAEDDGSAGAALLDLVAIDEAALEIALEEALPDDPAREE